MQIDDSSLQALLATWPLPTLSVAMLAWVVSQRPWRLLRQEPLQHAWLGGLVFLTLLWSARATVGTGVVVQLMGAPLAVTMFGLPLAMLTLAWARVLGRCDRHVSGPSVPSSTISAREYRKGSRNRRC